eukprot:5338168-Pleurochrysis_carterae.AAC.1
MAHALYTNQSSQVTCFGTALRRSALRLGKVQKCVRTVLCRAKADRLGARRSAFKRVWRA